jgi:hypothetical protein
VPNHEWPTRFRVETRNELGSSHGAVPLRETRTLNRFTISLRRFNNIHCNRDVRASSEVTHSHALSPSARLASYLASDAIAPSHQKARPDSETAAGQFWQVKSTIWPLLAFLFAQLSALFGQLTGGATTTCGCRCCDNDACSSGWETGTARRSGPHGASNKCSRHLNRTIEASRPAPWQAACTAPQMPGRDVNYFTAARERVVPGLPTLSGAVGDGR